MSINPFDPGWTTQGAYPQSEATIKATRTSVAAATTDVRLLAAGPRRGFTLWNDSTANLFLGLGTAPATATDASMKVAPGAYYEAPYNYSGEVRGIWDAVNGAARLTEIS